MLVTDFFSDGHTMAPDRIIQIYGMLETKTELLLIAQTCHQNNLHQTLATKINQAVNSDPDNLIKL